MFRQNYQNFRSYRKNTQPCKKAEKGAYSKSLPPKIQIQELDTKTAKATFPLLKGKRLDATVDYVFSGSRLKVNIPKENCVATFLIGGIECPRTERPRRDGQKGTRGNNTKVTINFFNSDLTWRAV